MKFPVRILAREKDTGKTVTFHVLDDGKYAVNTRMDIEPILEMNKAMAASLGSGWTRRGPDKLDMHHIAAIDTRVLQHLRDIGLWQDPKDRAKWLNDRDNSKWRTKGGKV